jgi:hypothetical protein
MPEPSSNENDLDLTLPSLDGEVEDEEEDVPPNAEDIGFAYFDDSEPVDLDTSIGIDYQFDNWEIYTFTETGENPTLSSEEEAKDLSYEAEGELIAGEEDGWLDESEPLDQEEWDLDNFIDDSVPESEEDSGEEGVNENQAVSDSDDETSLPPLDCTDDVESEGDEEGDSLGQRVLKEVADPRLIESEDE